MHYHLKLKQRTELGILLRTGCSQRQIAQLLNVHHSTIGRELRRNSSSRPNTSSGYHALDAQRHTTKRRQSMNQRFRKILPGSRLEVTIVDKIQNSKWAPEQIAGWLKATKQAIYICAQTIYNWVYTSRTDLVRFLRCRKGKYRHTRQARIRKEKRAILAALRNISNRSKHIEKRKTYGHWEG